MTELSFNEKDLLQRIDEKKDLVLYFFVRRRGLNGLMHYMRGVISTLRKILNL